jgi:hypothetical protein
MGDGWEGWNGWWIVAYAAAFAYCIVAAFGRRDRGRAEAERWLLSHGYRVRELGEPWWPSGRPSFGPSRGRDPDNACEFRAVVDDRRLGGTGVVWLRVWPDDDEPDVAWERRPNPNVAGAPAAGAPWDARQLALLARIAGQETRFRFDGADSAEAGAEFDALVEDLLAMQRRGLITCATPLAETRRPGRQYALVTDVSLTPEGLRIAKRNAVS